MRWPKIGLSLFWAMTSLSLLIVSCSLKNEEESVSNQLVTLSQIDQSLPDIIDFNFHVKPILSDRCFACHGPDKTKVEAGLSFATFEDATVKLGDHYALVPGNPKLSTMIDRIYSTDPNFTMPPPESNLSLSQYEKDVLKKWIEQGAKWKQHWSFLPIDNPTIPNINGDKALHNEIDNFISQKLVKNGLSRSDIASKERLIRRVAFDITGLPPSIEELDSFAESEDLQTAIDYYLSTPAYAENMAAQWMDIARYADTHGYQDDFYRTMWPWRDWVIHAFEKNMPYDEFVTWQLAGDLLPNASKEQVIATGFNRNHSITYEGGVIPEEYQTEYVSDRTNTFGKAFLGLTVECAKCHDHKYDPISQKDYYSLFSFFNNIPEVGFIENKEVTPEPYIELSDKEISETLTFIKNMDSMPSISLMIMAEMEIPRQTHILSRGAYDQPTVKVSSDVPASISPFDGYERNRLGLAKWLFDKNNPITARVAVNRIWQQCFGQGLVTTADDFGAQGALPTHPKLLDFLAYKFMADGWNIKKMIRYIMSSYTYQQSSKMSSEMLEIDPANAYYARAPRLRLTAEKIRDHTLASSGLLNSKIGGPSVKPYQPTGLWKEKVGGGGGATAEYTVDTDGNQYRRSLYTFWKRTVPPPSMMTFDAVSRDLCMVKRETTSTPLQALIMMNSPEIMEASKALAIQTIEMLDKTEDRLSIMFRKVTSRMPTSSEMKVLLNYLVNEKSKFENDKYLAAKYLKIDNKEDVDLSDIAAYTAVANTIYNLDESISKS